MAAEKTRAIVLRTFPFGESSCVVSLYTRDHGKLRALAKGAWRPKGSFDAALDLLSTCQVLVLRKSSDSLHLLTEAFLEHRFRVGRSLASYLAALDLAELLDALTADGDHQPELFDVAYSTLRTLSAPADGASVAGGGLADRDVRALATHTELALLRLLGHAPALVRWSPSRARRSRACVCSPARSMPGDRSPFRPPSTARCVPS
jgi:DNA repair protein RecO (recombination protein O)